MIPARIDLGCPASWPLWWWAFEEVVQLKWPRCGIWFGKCTGWSMFRINVLQIISVYLSNIHPSSNQPCLILSEFPGLSLPSLWNISHVAWPYVSLHSPILCHDISHYTIIVSHRSALFRIVFSITAQLDRALAGMTTTGGYRNYICLALPYVIWYCFSGPIYEIWACLSLLFEHTYLSSILSYINLFHLIRPIPIASCTNIPVAVGLLLVGWPPSHTGE